MTTRPLQILLLALAVLPSAIVALMAIYLYLTGGTDAFNWQSKIWPLAALQLVSIGAFWWHALGNKALSSGEVGEWVFEFAILIPFGMLSYWAKYVWEDRGLGR